MMPSSVLNVLMMIADRTQKWSRTAVTTEERLSNVLIRFVGIVNEGYT